MRCSKKSTLAELRGLAGDSARTVAAGNMQRIEKMQQLSRTVSLKLKQMWKAPIRREFGYYMTIP